MAIPATAFKRKKQKPRKEKEPAFDRNRYAGPLDPVLYRARKGHCKRCHIDVTVCQRESITTITCHTCGHACDEYASRIPRGMMRRLGPLAFLFGGKDGRQ